MRERTLHVQNVMTPKMDLEKGIVDPHGCYFSSQQVWAFGQDFGHYETS